MSSQDVPAPVHDTDTLVVEEPRFAIVPEWVIDADVNDAAFRLYSLLLRYGNASGARMPARPTLARRLRRSVDAVDRAMRQLTQAGIVRVEHRRRSEVFLSNRYHVRTSPPGPGGGGRTFAATPEQPGEGGRICAATPSRESAATVAANLRPDREVLTDTPPPPTPSTTPSPRPGRVSTVEEADQALLDACGITDLDALAQACAASRRALGMPVTRWSARCLLVVIRLAVTVKGWPAEGVKDALLTLARDPQTRSPARVAEAGPWWDAAVLGTDLRVDARELVDLEWRLSETGGLRPLVQAQARRELAAEGLPVTRRTVAQRACSILDQHCHTAGDPQSEPDPQPHPSDSPIRST
ncbi:MAG: hypothetical protein ACOYBY_14700 [Dermatophilaceae bacterium]